MYSLASTTESTEFTVVDPTTGIPTNADSTPTATLRRNESASGVTVTVTNLATGRYRASWTNGAWTAGDRLTLEVSANVSSDTYTETIWEAKIDVTASSRLAPTTAGRTIDIDANNNAEATVVGWNGVALSTTNPLPNAAPDAAGGLPISDAGGLDLDAKLANTNEITAARMGALTDWIDGGRLDLLLDALLDRLTATRAGYLDNLTGTDGVTLATTQPNYAPAKAGDAMALTSGERTTLSAAIEAAIINELDGTAVMQAIADLIADDMTTGDLTVQAIASAVRDAILDRVLSGNHDTAGTPGKILQDVYADTNELQTNQGNWVTATGFSTLDAAGVRSAVGLVSANLDTQLGAIVTDTNELQGDWTNGGRLDLILDAILEDTGTTLPATLATIASYIDTEITAIKAKTDNLPADPATETTLAALDTLMDAIKAVTDKLNTGLESDGLSGYQFTALALENGPSGGGGGDATAANQTSILAAIDALENVSQAQVQTACTSALTTYDPPTRTEATADKAEILTAVGNVGGSVGSGADSVTVTILHEITGLPIADADVWISTDVNGSNVVAGTLQTNSSGEVTFMLDAGETYYCWRQRDGINFDNPQSFTAVAD